MESLDPIKLVLILLILGLAGSTGFFGKKTTTLQESLRQAENKNSEYYRQDSILRAENEKLDVFVDSLILTIENAQTDIVEIRKNTARNIARVDSMSYSEKRSYFANRYGIRLSSDSGN